MSRTSLGLGGHRASRSAAARPRLGSSTSATDCQSDARALLSVGQILARRRGLPSTRCHTRVRFRARHFSPLRRPSGAECCSEPRSSLRRPTARFWLATEPSPPNSERPATPRLGGSDMRETWAGGPRGLGRSTLMDCRPSVHRGGLASGAFQLELQPSISCHRRSERAGMDPVRLSTSPAETAVVSPPREGRRRTSAEMLSTTWNRLTEGIAPCWRVGRGSARTPSSWDVARRSTHAVLSCVPVPRADTPSMASTVPTGRSPRTC